MHTITVDQIPTILDHLVFRKKEPVVFWGPGGIGKTQGIIAGCEAAGAMLWDCRPGQRESIDFSGLPNFKEMENGDQMTVWTLPDLLPVEGNPLAPDDKPIALFIDEFNASTSNAVFTRLMQLVNERMVGGRKLKDNVFIMLAGNREGDKGTATRSPFTMNNRMTHFEVVASFEALAKHAARKNWPGIFTAFWGFRKEHINGFNPGCTDKCVPTPRTWEKAIGYWVDEAMPAWLREASLAGSIGAGVANEFIGFTKIWDSLKDLLPQIRKDPANADIDMHKLDVVYAVVVALAGEMDAKNAGNTNVFLKRLPAEMRILAWQLALERNDNLYNTPEFTEMAKEYKSVFYGN